MDFFEVTLSEFEFDNYSLIYQKESDDWFIKFFDDEYGEIIDLLDDVDKDTLDKLNFDENSFKNLKSKNIKND